MIAVAVLPQRALAVDFSCADAGRASAVCGHVTCGDDLLASDSLLALQAAVGIAHCSMCRCDTDDSGSIGASDAYRILRRAIDDGFALSCAACPALEIVRSDDPTVVGARATTVVSTHDGGVLAAVVGSTEITTQRFDAALMPTGPAWVMPMTTSGKNFVTMVCARADGSVAAGWYNEDLEGFPAPHDYDDMGNAFLSEISSDGVPSGVIPANPAQNGAQSMLAVFCEDDGNVLTITESDCIAGRDTGGAVTIYTPQHCPLNGIYVRTFDALGDAVTEPTNAIRTFSQWYVPWSRPVLVPDGHIALSSFDSLLVIDRAGNLLSHVKLPGDQFNRYEHDCSAGPSRCAAANGDAIILVYDIADAATAQAIAIDSISREYDPPYEVVTGPANVKFACDDRGICVVEYVMLREKFGENYPEGDYESEVLGSFARALDVHTGELGLRIESAAAGVVNVARGRFVSIEYDDNNNTLLRSLEVR